MLTAHFRLKTSIYYVRYLRVITKNIIKLYLKIIIGFIITWIFLNLHFYLTCQKLNESRSSEIYFRYAKSVQCSKINWYNPKYQQAKRGKSYDPTNWGRKVFDKIWHSFIIKILNELEVEGHFFNLEKNIDKYD